MANSYLSPNMSLVIPVPTVDPGPDWSYNLNSSLTILDQHSHVTGSGVQITPPAININSDLTFNLQNATSLRSVRFNPNLSPLATGSDLGCIYEAGVDLYYNDGSGNQIRITQGGSLAGAAGTITGLPSGTASASYAVGVFTFEAATNTAANIDAGSYVFRNNTLGSFGLTLQPPNAMGANYSITLPALPGQTNVMTLDTSGNMGSITYDDVGVNMTSVGANALRASTTRAVGSVAGIGGVAISASCGLFNTASAAYFPVTNLSVTLTTSGRPVMLIVQNDGSGGSNYSQMNSPPNAFIMVQNNNGGIQFQSQYFFESPSGATIAAFTLSALDTAVNGLPGTYQYQVFLKNLGAVSAVFNNYRLIAYEI